MLLNCHFRFVQGEIGKPFSKKTELIITKKTNQKDD